MIRVFWDIKLHLPLNRQQHWYEHFGSPKTSDYLYIRLKVSRKGCKFSKHHHS